MYTGGIASLFIGDMILTSGVYAIINTTNGHFYVGSSIEIEKRWYTHLNFLRKGEHANRKLQAAWNRDSEKAFRFTTLDTIDDKVILRQEEQRLLDRVFGKVCCYNLSPSVEEFGRSDAKVYDLRDNPLVGPDGKVYLAIKNLKRFAVEHGLSDVSLGDVIRGNAISTAGWKLQNPKPSKTIGQPKKVTSEDLQLILELRAKGKSYAKIALSLGGKVCRQTIQHIVSGTL